MKKNYLFALLALVCNFAFAQLQVTAYKGAFAPAPTEMWTNGWTNFNPNQAVYGTATVNLSGEITADRTLDATKVYNLKGIVTVRNNAKLIIPAGTVIRSNTPSSALVITRGSKLIANGTASQPIVFTSNNAVGARNRGDWGGIVLLGKGRYNTNNGVNFIEGLSQTVNTEFGGGLTPDNDDNSGSLNYVRIEFAGYVLSPNNELNGLTMGAVGKGTVIDYVQVSYSNDDSFEWFGGSVNCKHLVAFAGLDDDFDTDNGYKGIVQFGLSVKDPLAADISTSECFESDNNSSGNATPVAYGDFTSAKFSNFTCIGANKRPTPSGFVSPNSLHDKAVRIRRASKQSIFNSIFIDHKKGYQLESLESNQYGIAGDLKFKNNIVVSPTPFATVTTTTTSSPTIAAITTWFNSTSTYDNATPPVLVTAGNDNKTFTANDGTASTGVLVRAYATNSATNYLTITDNNDIVNIDYRPSSQDAKTGASFTDSAFDGLTATGSSPVVANVTYCKGEIALPLTAAMTSAGISLKWYSQAAGGTALSATPTPTTTNVGTTSYWVSEVINNNGTLSESDRAKIDVIVVALPTTTFPAIKSYTSDGSTIINAILDVSTYVGTTTTVSYTVETVLPSGETYNWTVPNGVNIVSGQGTNRIVVNYANVPAGLSAIGDIKVQAKNTTTLCSGTAKVIKVAAKLPSAPATLKINTIPSSGDPEIVTEFLSRIGTNDKYKLLTETTVGATSYIFQVPSVNVRDLGTSTGTPVTKMYNAYPFNYAISSAPTSPGNVYYTVTETTYPDNVSVFTARKIRIAGTTGGMTFTAYNEPITNKTATDATMSPTFPYVNTPNIYVNIDFSTVTSSSLADLTLTFAAFGKNNVGNSKGKTLAIKATLPKAPTAVNGRIVGICGNSSIAYTIDDTVANNNASSYVITAPTGCTVTSSTQTTNASNVLTTLSTDIAEKTFTVNYPAGFSTTIAKSISVKSKNNLGLSTAAKAIKLSTAMPSVIADNANQTIFDRRVVRSYSVTDATATGATSYVWTVADGATIVSGQGTRTITVNFSAVLPSKLTNKLTVRAVNACGVSSKTLTLTLDSYSLRSGNLEQDNVEMYPNPATDYVNFNFDATSNGLIDVTIYSLDGKVVMESNGLAVENGTNSFTENVSSLSKGIYLVKITNTTSNEVVTKKLIKN